MSNSISIDSDAVMAEARNHPRYNNDPNLYEKLAYLKLSAAKDRRDWAVIRQKNLDTFQNIEDNLNDMTKAVQRCSERVQKSLVEDFIMEVTLYLWLGFLGLLTWVLLLRILLNH